MTRFVFMALALIALSFDFALFRLWIRRRKTQAMKTYSSPKPGKPWISYAFWTYALLTNVVLLLVIFLAYRWPFFGPHSISRVPLWLAWWFLLNAIPKSCYLLFYALSRLWKSLLPGSGRWLRGMGIVLSMCIIALMVKGAFYDSRNFKLSPVDLYSPKIPPAFDGYRIVFFSDLHLGNLVNPQAFLSEFVAQANALEPDLLLHGGDLVNMYADEIRPELMDILSQLRAKDGIYSVLGNHDMGPYISPRVQALGWYPLENTRRVRQKSEAMGWKMLENASLQISRDSLYIGLSGLPYPPMPPHFPDSLTHFDPEATTRDLDTSVFNIMLCHTPKVWSPGYEEVYPSLRKIDLMLSGHTHAMQFKLRAGGRAWSPVQWKFPQWAGLYERDGRYLYVNEGLGYVVYPMRIGSRPEITLVTLHHSSLALN